MKSFNFSMISFFNYLFHFAITAQLWNYSYGWSKGANLNAGFAPAKTLGQVWPLPQQISQESTYVTLDAQNFQFIYEGVSCPIIDSAISRYKTIIFNPPRFSGCFGLNKYLSPTNLRATLPNLKVTLTGDCESLPYLQMDESYTLKVDSADLPGAAQLTAGSTWGILRGLETFSQLVYHDDTRNFYANSSDIVDFPRFSYRGFLLDTSRHYVPLETLKQHLDAMAYNKLNVFHWHITDDQSFPYQSQMFPSMSEKGAYNPETHIYTFNDITSIISYASERGIRVIPEFDTPGHTQSWGLGIPDLLTECYIDGLPTADYGPIDPSKNSTFDFLRQFFTEAAALFPDDYIHLGGDEVKFTCWASNPAINTFMQKMGFGMDYRKLESYYINQLLNIVSTIPNSKNYIVWQEVFDDGCEINPDTVVHVWKNFYERELGLVTGQGYKAILSSCWYLNTIHYGNDWYDIYNCEPLSFEGNQTQYDLVMGGAGCMWAEWVDATNLISKTWPRASAISERLWSARDVNDTNAAAPRLEEQRCRLLERNINAEPINGPGYCDSDYLLI